VDHRDDEDGASLMALGRFRYLSRWSSLTKERAALGRDELA
jgi:hypothetical protein